MSHCFSVCVVWMGAFSLFSLLLCGGCSGFKSGLHMISYVQGVLGK